MQLSKLTLILMFFFLIEGTWLNWMIPVEWQSSIVVSPHLVMVLVCYIGIFLGRRTGLVFGLGFGLLHDIVYYGPMIGTFCMAMGVVGYLAGMFRFKPQGNILTSLFVVAVSEFTFEWLIYGIYRVLAVTRLTPERVFLQQILPSIFINLLFALLIYIPVRNLLERVKAQRVRTE
ncbi:rod shape-determining protein MreD [Gorillibacterium massiliense]|uniref:rod shape-determining protein MreD n=1 Tax=Gorillibacterium massiliense TaxID=1280390 RepID=UPI0004B7A5EC|nr:rod shape-determining protein MreD [Gorillibacterium massiliense]